MTSIGPSGLLKRETPFALHIAGLERVKAARHLAQRFERLFPLMVAEGRGGGVRRFGGQGPPENLLPEAALEDRPANRLRETFLNHTWEP